MFETMNAINAMNTNLHRTADAQVINLSSENQVRNRAARNARNSEDLFYRVNRFNDPYVQSDLVGMYQEDLLAG